MAQDDKKMVDADFAIAKRNLKRVLNESRLDVIFLEYIIEALAFDKGLLNTVIETVKINRNHEGLQKCVSIFGSIML